MDYDDQLDRALSETPEASESGSRLEIPEPSVRGEGSVTVVENFRSIADRLDRDPEHVMGYLQTAVGTSASIDDAGRLRLTGSFDAGRLSAELETYAERFVRCPECGLPDTTLETEQGAEVRQCTACGARSATGG